MATAISPAWNRFARHCGGKHDFGHSSGTGGILAYSRILFDREVVVVANTSTTQTFKGQVLMDIDLNRPRANFSISYSNLGKQDTKTATIIKGARFFASGNLTGVTDIAAVEVSLSQIEIQIFVPQ